MANSKKINNSKRESSAKQNKEKLNRVKQNKTKPTNIKQSKTNKNNSNKNNSNKNKSNKSNLKKKKNSRGKRIAKRIFAILGICVLICFAVVGIRALELYNEYADMAEAIVTEGGDDAFMTSLTSTVYGANGEVIAELCGSRDSAYLKDAEIPYIVKRAFVVSEDRKFYEHSGVDYSAMMRAVLALIKNEGEITQGGSTITQQLARNIFLSHEVSIERKVKEIFIAWELEDRYSKDDIMEFYVNNIYFGNGLYGIEAAAEGYFNKNTVELTISEMVFLCSIPNNPSLYDPFEHKENTIKRRDRILKQMYELGEIDQSLYIEATNEEITLTPGTKVKNNYEETFIRYCATLELMRAYGFEFKNSFSTDEEKTSYDEEYQRFYSECNSRLFSGGYTIYTTIDMKMQENLQKSIDSILESYQDKNKEGIYEFQSSATCIDNSTGYVVAIVGGRSNEYNGYTLNRAYQSYRQPGSSIKPILVYTPLFELGYTPNSLVIDEKIEGGPKNANKKYIGPTYVRYAVEQSINTIAWKSLQEIGIDKGMSYLKRMNFSKIVKEDYVPAAAIGGLTYGVSSYEMAAAYATIENDGVYRNPTCIRKIIDANDNTIVDNGINTDGQKTVYEANATRMMTDVLKGVLTSGTGTSYNVSNAICAGKTGTTNDVKDVWFAGYSHYYTTAVWCGYDMPKEIDAQVGKKTAGKIWQNYMEVIHEGKELVEFKPYFDIVPIYPEYSEEETTTEEETPGEMITTEKIPDELYTDPDSDETYTEEDTTDENLTDEMTTGEMMTDEITTEEMTTDEMITDEETTEEIPDELYTDPDSDDTNIEEYTTDGAFMGEIESGELNTTEKLPEGLYTDDVPD